MTKSGAGVLQLIYLPQARSDLILYADGSVLKCGLACISDTCLAVAGPAGPQEGLRPSDPLGSHCTDAADRHLPASPIDLWTRK